MPVERIDLTGGDASLTAELELPEGESDRGAVLLSGANHVAFDDAVFDHLASAAAEAGVQFLRYQSWDDGEELAAKAEATLRAEVDAALQHLHERRCDHVSLVGKSAGGAIALQYVPDAADAMVLWAPAIFLEGGDALAQLDVPEGAEPSTLSPEHLAGIDVPVHILQGDEDHIPVANARELAAEIPEGSVTVIEGADHSFVGGDPEDEVVETTVDVLAGL